MIAQLIQHPATEWNLENVSLALGLAGVIAILELLRKDGR